MNEPPVRAPETNAVVTVALPVAPPIWPQEGAVQPQLFPISLTDIKRDDVCFNDFYHLLSSDNEEGCISSLCLDFARNPHKTINGFALQGFVAGQDDSILYQCSLAGVLGIDLEEFTNKYNLFERETNFQERLYNGSYVEPMSRMVFYLCAKIAKDNRCEITLEIVNTVCSKIEKMCNKTKVMGDEHRKVSLSGSKQEVVFIFVCASILGISPEKFLNFAKKYQQTFSRPISFFTNKDKAGCLASPNSIQTTLDIRLNRSENIELYSCDNTASKSFDIGLRVVTDEEGGGRFIAKGIIEVPFRGNKIRSGRFSAGFEVNQTLKDALECEYGNSKFLMEHGVNENVRFFGKCCVAKYNLKKYCEALGKHFPRLKKLNAVFDCLGVQGGAEDVHRDGIAKVKRLFVCNDELAGVIFDFLVESRFDDARVKIANINIAGKTSFIRRNVDKSFNGDDLPAVNGALAFDNLKAIKFFKSIFNRTAFCNSLAFSSQEKIAALFRFGEIKDACRFGLYRGIGGLVEFFAPLFKFLKLWRDYSNRPGISVKRLCESLEASRDKINDKNIKHVRKLLLKVFERDFADGKVATFYAFIHNEANAALVAKLNRDRSMQSWISDIERQHEQLVQNPRQIQEALVENLVDPRVVQVVDQVVQNPQDVGAPIPRVIIPPANPDANLGNANEITVQHPVYN